MDTEISFRDGHSPLLVAERPPSQGLGPDPSLLRAASPRGGDAKESKMPRAPLFRKHGRNAESAAALRGVAGRRPGDERGAPARTLSLPEEGLERPQAPKEIGQFVN